MKSKKIVIASTGSLGKLHPAMALALELKARGHQIAFATSAVYRAKIEQAGINYHLLRPDLLYLLVTTYYLLLATYIRSSCQTN